jgi:hypothetical protein
MPLDPPVMTMFLPANLAIIISPVVLRILIDRLPRLL